MRSRLMTVMIVRVVLTIAGAGVLYAAGNGPVDPPNPPATTSSYTLEQIYQRLATGNYFAQQSGFTEPASGPGTGTMHTLDEIMAKAPRMCCSSIRRSSVPRSRTSSDDMALDANYDAVVDGAGNFRGYTWSENLGWIKFSGTAGDNTPYLAQVRCAIDVNASGTVDVIDVQLVTSAFGLNVPAYDFNKDGLVNVSDIQFVANRWLIGC